MTMRMPREFGEKAALRRESGTVESVRDERDMLTGAGACDRDSEGGPGGWRGSIADVILADIILGQERDLIRATRAKVDDRRDNFDSRRESNLITLI